MKKGWEMKKLGEVCKTGAGGTPLKAHKDYYEGGDIPWLLSGEVSQGEIFEAKNFITQKGLDNSSAKLFPPNTVLIAMYGATAGQVGLLRFNACTNQAVCGILPNKMLSPEFIYYYFLSKKDELISQATGNAQPNISQIKIRETKIPTLSISEQQQIVSILDEAFTAIDQAKENLQRNLQNAIELFKGKLNSIFTTKGTDWVERRIENVSKVVNGFSFKSNDFSPKNKIKSVKITNVGVKEFVEETDNYLPDSFSKTYSEYSVQEGNIVIALTRTIISNGLKVAVVPESYEGALINQRVAALVPDTKIVNQRFLYNFLCTDSVMNYVKANVNTLMQPNLSINDLKKMPINLPSLQSQKKIILQLDKLSTETKALENIYQQKLDHLEDLKKSILKKAFSGELSSPEGAFSAKDGHRPSNQKTPSLTSPERA